MPFPRNGLTGVFPSVGSDFLVNGWIDTPSKLLRQHTLIALLYRCAKGEQFFAALGDI
jgi:hypothetical protein